MNELKVGDVIVIEMGMHAIVSVPAKFIFSNTPFETRCKTKTVSIGDILRTPTIVQVESQIPLAENAFINAIRNMGAGNPPKIDISDLPSYEQESFNTSIFVGEYVVVDVQLDRGLVTCDFIGDKELTVRFYTEDSKYAPSLDIKPIRQMKRQFV